MDLNPVYQNSMKRRKNKFEMSQTIISFINLIPDVLKLAYRQFIYIA